jgi:cytoskeletal protein RodZ
MNIHTFLVLAALAEFLAAVSIISTIWIWLNQKKLLSDELNRTAVGHRVPKMKTPSSEEEASIKPPTGQESKTPESVEARAQSSPDEPDDSEASANSSDNRSVENESDWPPPIQRPE